MNSLNDFSVSILIASHYCITFIGPLYAHNWIYVTYISQISNMKLSFRLSVWATLYLNLIFSILIGVSTLRM